MAINYTDAQVEELKAHKGKFNYEIATIFGEKHGISARSVVSKIKALGLDYDVKKPGEKPAKKAAAKRTKTEIVDAINEETSLDLKSLGNMTINDLETLEGYFKALAEAE